MKKISILLFAVMMAGSLSAQIESIVESDHYVSNSSSTPSVSQFNKIDYLQPYKGELSICSNNVVNVIGEQVFCKMSSYISPTKSRYVIMIDKNGLSLSKIEQGKYYYVKDILITSEETNRLNMEFNDMAFKSDTLYYVDVDIDNIALLLEKSEPLPKKVKQYIISKADVFPILFEHRTWPPEWNLPKSQNIENAIYVLVDENGREYYIPKDNRENKQAYELKIRQKSVIFKPGFLADISCFVTVNGYLNIKKKFENRPITKRKYMECTNEEILMCKKIAFRRSAIVAEVEDTVSKNTFYLSIKDIVKKNISQCQQKDTLLFLSTNSEEYYCTTYDMDSIEYKKLMEEQEILRKDERKKQELIKKYGSKIGQSIADGKACIGMNKEQCKEALGAPDNITKNTSNLGSVEVWTYSLGYQIYNGRIPITVVTFLDDKVTSVDEYQSWPY